MQAFHAADAGLVDGLLFSDQVEDLLAGRLGQDPDDRLRKITIQDYARVPDAAAGIQTGRAGEVAVVYAEGTMSAGKSDSPTAETSTAGPGTLGPRSAANASDSSNDAPVSELAN